MKTVFFKGTAIFFVLLVATSVMVDVFHTEFGTVNFYQKHGIFFLIFITLFPRLTLIFSSVPFGGIFWWLGFFFCPRVLVASLATVSYFHTNPVLVTISWLVAIGGEYVEKSRIGAGRNQFIFRTYRMGGTPYHEDRGEKVAINRDDAIEAEFRKD
jgi:hypothetical protein